MRLFRTGFAMHPMKLRAVPRGLLVLALIEGFAFVTLSTCAVLSPPSLPDEYLGRWYFEGSSGGITGAGLGGEAEGYIVILSDNRIEHHEDGGALVGVNEFTASRGPTIFSTEEQWILNRGVETTEVITYSDDGQTMTLSENAYDGFARSYARLR
jgi:hypothetical protein